MVSVLEPGPLDPESSTLTMRYLGGERHCESKVSCPRTQQSTDWYRKGRENTRLFEVPAFICVEPTSTDIH